jgi:hypothetical protein
MMPMFAFFTFGLLVGTLIGLTSESVVSGFLPILFAFGGGSIIAFLDRFHGEERTIALIGIASLSIGTLVGTVHSAGSSKAAPPGARPTNSRQEIPS